MPVQVVVGANAQSDAAQFVSAVNDFQSTVSKLVSVGQRLSSGSDWQGASATKFHADFQTFQGHVKVMEAALHGMGTAAKSIIDHIDQIDAQGVGQIGTFTA